MAVDGEQRRWWFRVYEPDEFLPVVILFCKYNQITKGHFDHFCMSTLEIKFFYENARRGYGGEGRICLFYIKSIFLMGSAFCTPIKLNCTS